MDCFLIPFDAPTCRYISRYWFWFTFSGIFFSLSKFMDDPLKMNFQNEIEHKRILQEIDLISKFKFLVVFFTLKIEKKNLKFSWRKKVKKELWCKRLMLFMFFNVVYITCKVYFSLNFLYFIINAFEHCSVLVITGNLSVTNFSRGQFPLKVFKVWKYFGFYWRFNELEMWKNS